MIHYKANPFFLSDSAIDWVEKTYQKMTLEEKIGQLFCPVGSFQKPEEIHDVVDRYHIGGVLYRPGKAQDIQDKHRLFQQHSKIPLLIASNLETGGCGAAEEGTFYGKQMLIAATGKPERAYQLGKPVTFADVKAVVDQLLKDQLEKERRLLWNHNLKQEIMELEIYHALVDGTNGVEKEHYFSKLAVHLDLHGTENDGTIELQQIAWTNIFRWCAPRCIPIFVEQNGQTLNYILLAETMEQLPDPQEIVEHVRGLMDIPFRIQVLQCAEVKELIDNRPSTIEQDKVEDDIIAKARKFISEHLSENISRADVADAVHLDSSYFSKYFKKKCGMTFREYLQDERIKRAKEMIEAGYKIKDVAEKCGFSNRNYFNEIFKKSTGQTASEYKRGQLR